MNKIVDKTDRNVLGEGRNYQMGFAFAKKTAPKTFELVQPISPCKDYLNDVVWSEATNKSIQAYGLNYSKKDIFNGKKSYMVIGIMPSWGGSPYPSMDKDIKNLEENIENLTAFLNFIEKKLKLKCLTKIEKVAKNRYLLEFDYYWCKTTYLISLYSLLLRTGQFWKGDPDPITYWKTFKDFPPDTYMVQTAATKLEKIIKNGAPEHDMSSMAGGTTVHNHGILAHAI